MFYITYYKAKKMVDGTLEVQMTYGNVSSFTMMVNQTILKNINLTKSYIMKHVLVSMMLGREKCILNLVWVNDISRIAWDVSYL